MRKTYKLIIKCLLLTIFIFLLLDIITSDMANKFNDRVTSLESKVEDLQETVIQLQIDDSHLEDRVYNIENK